MSKENIFHNVGEDIKLANMGLSLLFSKYNKELKEAKEEKREPVVNKEIKEGLIMLHQIIDRTTKQNSDQHFEREKEEKENTLRSKNLKIQEMEKRLGEKVRTEDLSHFIKKLTSDIRDEADKYGLSTHPKIEINEHHISLELEYISHKKNDTKYARTQEEINEIVENNERREKAFFENFDGVESDDFIGDIVRMTNKNIKLLEKIANASIVRFETRGLTNGTHAKTIDQIRNMTFVAYTTEPLKFERTYLED